MFTKEIGLRRMPMANIVPPRRMLVDRTHTVIQNATTGGAKASIRTNTAAIADTTFAMICCHATAAAASTRYDSWKTKLSSRSRRRSSASRLSRCLSAATASPFGGDVYSSSYRPVVGSRHSSGSSQTTSSSQRGVSSSHSPSPLVNLCALYLVPSLRWLSCACRNFFHTTCQRSKPYVTYGLPCIASSALSSRVRTSSSRMEALRSTTLACRRGPPKLSCSTRSAFCTYE
mmetsp:Transcript_9908/g.25629  ORF Transcript_9908/g.25629 Transcript_9908/m.25629 type:complete len:231 (+) Transcript_9908:808-1500(+)